MNQTDCSREKWSRAILRSLSRAGILEQSTGARNRVEIGFARLHGLAEWILGIDSWAPKKFENTVSEPSNYDKKRTFEKLKKLKFLNRIIG